eukprot:CAMPEP_0181407444 /NCGR_PEP_ID=MMETSP1110-20121109/5785_1 /TAXON_ID=174948 /ORGANISM="Symbiodinium sp., Strain CCMP421" /LENGTH=95 /DNA_ID=CAMNT_0023529877 /DNA_START=644 /DNA_END=931 /DNA_ORIENTATION=-
MAAQPQCQPRLQPRSALKAKTRFGLGAASASGAQRAQRRRARASGRAVKRRSGSESLRGEGVVLRKRCHRTGKSQMASEAASEAKASQAASSKAR